MNPRNFLYSLAFALVCATCAGQTASDPNEGARLTRDPAAGIYQFSWWGIAGRTYFLQQSENLADWTYLPVIESGASQIIQWGTSSLADRSFMRLRYSDLATTDPFTADFDSDGVSNYDELLQGTDPLSWHDGDSTHGPNGLPDEWELYYFGSLGVSPSADPDGDGLTNLQEFQAGSNPNDFSNGHALLLAKTSGDNQDGYTAAGTPAALSPIKVRITDAITGAALPNASITFATSSTAVVQLSSTPDPGASWSELFTASTDASGYASAWLKMPAAVPQSDQVIIASATATGAVQFIVHVPNGLDSDGNGLADSWEMTHFGSLGHDPGGDDDHDGLSNADEMLEGSDPNKPDTDDDGIPDGQDAVVTDPDIKIPRYPVPTAYAVIDLTEFVPTNLNDLGQMAGYWDDGTASDHFIDGIPGVWSKGDFYPFEADFPTHNFSEDPNPYNQHGPIIDEWSGTLMGIDNQGNVHFTDYVDLAAFDSEEDPSFVASSHFNGETFEPIVAEGADNYRSWQEVVQVSAGGGVLTGGFVEFSWTPDDHGHRIVYRMSGASGTLQGMPDGNDRDDLTFPNGSGVYHNAQGWDDLIDGGSFSINSSGQTVGTFVDYFGTTSVGDITSPYHNPERGTAHAIAWGFSPTAKIEMPGSDHPGQYYGLNDLKIVTGKTDELGATIWLGDQNLKRKALPLAPGTSSHDFPAGMMNNRGQMLPGFPGIAGALWQNTRLFSIDQMVAAAGYKEVRISAINNTGMMLGTATYASTDLNRAPGAGTSSTGNGTTTVLLVQATLECPKADTKVPPDTNPTFFGSPSPPDPTLSKSKEPALVVFYKDVIDSAFVVQPFTTTMNFGPNLSGATWAQSAGPSGIGHLEDANLPIARFVDPDAGGLFQFDASFPSAGTVRTSLILPLAGAEVKNLVSSDLRKADAFATKVLATYNPLEININVSNGLRWFYNGGAGDYLGRPDNHSSKTCVRFNPVDDKTGMGAVATWFGVPVRVAKVSNYVVGYACNKIGVWNLDAWLSQSLGTHNDAAATASFNCGWELAGGTKSYWSDTVTMLKANFYNSDVKNQRLWPNAALLDNHVPTSSYVDPNTQFISPGFVDMAHP